MSDSSMRTKLDFEDDKTKILLSKFDVVYFLEKNIEENNYSKKDIDTIQQEYNTKLLELKNRRKFDNRRQNNLYVEGQARKMFHSGFIPSLFHLDYSKGYTFIDFKTAGEDLAYFKLWQDYHKSKVTQDRIRSYITYIIKIVGIVGLILGILKLFKISAITLLIA